MQHSVTIDFKHSTLFSLIFLVALFNSSCKNNSTPDSESPSENIVEIPEDFVSFYEQFHADTSFQLNHIVFPLNQKSDGSKWQKDSWQFHKPFNSQNGSYHRAFDNLNGIITETIAETNQAFVITRRFARMGSEYHLIQYSITNNLEMWGEKIIEDSLNQTTVLDSIDL